MRYGTVRLLNHGSFIPQMRGVLMSCQPRSVRGEVVTRPKARFGCRTRIFPPSPPHLLDRFCALIHLQLILYRTSDYPPSCPFSMPPLVALRPTALAPHRNAPPSPVRRHVAPGVSRAPPPPHFSPSTLTACYATRAASLGNDDHLNSLRHSLEPRTPTTFFVIMIQPSIPPFPPSDEVITSIDSYPYPSPSPSPYPYPSPSPYPYPYACIAVPPSVSRRGLPRRPSGRRSSPPRRPSPRKSPCWPICDASVPWWKRGTKISSRSVFSWKAQIPIPCSTNGTSRCGQNDHTYR